MVVTLNHSKKSKFEGSLTIQWPLVWRHDLNCWYKNLSHSILDSFKEIKAQQGNAHFIALTHHTIAILSNIHISGYSEKLSQVKVLVWDTVLVYSFP